MSEVPDVWEMEGGVEKEPMELLWPNWMDQDQGL